MSVDQIMMVENIIILPRKTNAVIFYYYINSKFQIPQVNLKAFLNLTLSYLANLVISKQCISITFSSSHTYPHTNIPISITSSLHNLPSHPWNDVSASLNLTRPSRISLNYLFQPMMDIDLGEQKLNLLRVW